MFIFFSEHKHANLEAAQKGFLCSNFNERSPENKSSERVSVCFSCMTLPHVTDAV